MDETRLDFPFEVKLATSSATGAFEGYASVFGGLDSHRDRIKPGAFADSLAQRKAAGRTLPMYMQHGALRGGDPRPVGVWDQVAEDSRGLAVKGHLVGLDTDQGRYNHALVKEGAMRGLSVGYRVPQGGVTYGKAAGEAGRTLHKLDLIEISLVDDPSDPAAGVHSVKLNSQRELDHLLRNGGLSKAAAAKVIAGGWSALNAGDPDEDRTPQIKSLSDLLKAATADLRKG